MSRQDHVQMTWIDFVELAHVSNYHNKLAKILTFWGKNRSHSFSFFFFLNISVTYLRVSGFLTQVHAIWYLCKSITIYHTRVPPILICSLCLFILRVSLLFLLLLVVLWFLFVCMSVFALFNVYSPVCMKKKCFVDLFLPVCFLFRFVWLFGWSVSWFVLLFLVFDDTSSVCFCFFFLFVFLLFQGLCRRNSETWRASSFWTSAGTSSAVRGLNLFFFE